MPQAGVYYHARILNVSVYCVNHIAKQWLSTGFASEPQFFFQDQVTNTIALSK